MAILATALAALFLLAAQVSSKPAPVVNPQQLEDVLRQQLLTVGANGTTTDCDMFNQFELSFKTAAPCECKSLDYNIPENLVNVTSRQATFMVSLQCTAVPASRVVTSWKNLVPALPVPFSADFNISSMAIYYGISLVSVTADTSAANSWNTLFSTPFNNQPNVVASVAVLELMNCVNVLANGNTINLMAPQFVTLKQIVVDSDPTLRMIPSNAISITPPRPVPRPASENPIEVVFRNTGISQVADDALANLDKQRTITTLVIADSKLNSIPYGLLDNSITNLQNLTLSGNTITSAGNAPSGTYLPSIQKLDLSRNNIKALDGNAIWNIDSTIRTDFAPSWIDLSQNQIASVATDTFRVYAKDPRSITVDLSTNNLQSLGDFTNKNHLLPTMLINFSNNKLSKIVRHQFSDEWLAAQAAAMPAGGLTNLFAGNPLLCSETDLGWFACLIQHQLNSSTTTPTPPLMCVDGGVNRTTTDWVSKNLSPDGTCFYYFPEDGDIFQPVVTTPSPVTPTTAAPIIPNACNKYAALGLDFSTQMQWPCVCNSIISEDLPCTAANPNCSRGDCTGTQQAMFLLDITCANSDTTRVQMAWKQMHYELPAAFTTSTGATSLFVLHEITLANISVNTDVWEDEQTTWNSLLNTTVLAPTPVANSKSLIEGITFTGTTLNETLSGITLQLNLGPAFAALETLRIVDTPWLTQLPANFVKLAAYDADLKECIGGVLNIVISNTKLSNIHPQAFSALLPLVDGPMFTISNSKLTAIPFAAMRPFNVTYQMDFSGNQITTADLRLPATVPYCLGDLSLANNQIGSISDKAFWNNMTTLNDTLNTTVALTAPSSIVLSGNPITTLSTNAFKVSQIGQKAKKSGLLIDLSNTKLPDAHANGAFANLVPNAEVRLVGTQIKTINQNDLNPQAWTGTEQPMDFAGNPFDCNQKSLQWFACWAQHTAGGMNEGDRLSYLRCKDAQHLDISLHDLVVRELNDNGICHNFYPEDQQFSAVYPCNTYANYQLDFSTFAKPCTCNSISSAQTDAPLKNATIVVDLSCTGGDTSTLKNSWMSGLNKNLPAPFAAQFAVEQLTLKYKIALDSVKLSSAASWAQVLSLPVAPPHTTVHVETISLNNIDFGQTSTLKLDFVSPIFDSLQALTLTNVAPVVTTLPRDAFTLPPQTNTTVVPDSFLLLISGTNLQTIDSLAFNQLASLRKTNINFRLSHSALAVIPVDALRDFQQLTSLSLRSNQIKSVEYNQGHEPTGVTTVLDLSHNQIMSISDAYWDHLNSSQSLPSYLLLNDNKISTLGDNAFQIFSALTTQKYMIDLRNNLLPSIPAKTMQMLPGNVQVNFTNNQITLISPSDFSVGMAAGMDNSLYNSNPYICANSLTWFACWAQHTTGSLNEIQNLMCKTNVPLQPPLQSLTKLVMANMGQCHTYFPEDPIFGGGTTTTTTTTTGRPSSATSVRTSLYTNLITLALAVVVSTVMLFA